MSTPPRLTRPATAHVAPSPQRWVALVDDDPVDVRCFRCMAEVIQTWACLSEEGRPRIFCTEKCMKEYWAINRIEPEQKDPPDRTHSPAVQRYLAVKVPDVPTPSSTSSHIDLSKRVSHKGNHTPPPTSLNRSSVKEDGKQ